MAGLSDQSILTTIKKKLGIAEDYEYFDTDIIITINSCFATLHQLGVGPKLPYSISDKNNIWSEFIETEDRINSVADYVYLKTRLIFDPPTNSTVLQMYKEQCQEYEWRLRVVSETLETEE